MSTPLRTYYNGPRGPMYMVDHVNQQTRYFHCDTQGTVQCLTDGTGAVTDRFACDAWGAQVKRTGSSINRHWYIGRSGYYRDTTGLDYVRARYLSARQGRWLSRDPLYGPTPGLPLPRTLAQQMLNNAVQTMGASREAATYLYGGNAPTRRIDPLGLFGLEANMLGSPQVSCSKCGVARTGVRWGVPKGSNGSIVQMVLVHCQKRRCCTNETLSCVNGDQFYLEAWRVVDGKVYVPTEDPGIVGPIRSMWHDRFFTADEGWFTYGSITKSGFAVFIPGYVPQRGFWAFPPANVPEAGRLPTTDVGHWPVSFGGPGLANAGHELRVTWNCCPFGYGTRATAEAHPPSQEAPCK